MRTHQHGLTALDLLVTLTIITILVSAGVPSLRSFGFNQRMQAAVTSLQSDLQYARGEAVHLGAHAVICPGKVPGGCDTALDWHSGWLVFADLDGDRNWQSSEPLLRVGTAVEAVAITSANNRRRLRFFPNGTAPGSNVTVHFCDRRGGAHARQIRISNSGRIRRTNDPDSCI